MPATTALDSVEDLVRRRGDDLVELSHAIHAEPELAFAEHRSCAKAQALVAERGFEITPGAAGLDTAFRADFGSGPLVVGVCAEYDALPEIGHACGHNIIAASAVGGVNPGSSAWRSTAVGEPSAAMAGNQPDPSTIATSCSSTPVRSAMACAARRASSPGSVTLGEPTG